MTTLWRAQPGPLRTALLADTHIGADPTATFREGYNPATSAASALAPVLEFSPEATIFLGDLAWGYGEDDDYCRWREIFGPLIANRLTVLLPGNHDRRDRMIRHFCSDSPEKAERTISVLETPDSRLIGLDSLYRTDVVPGLLGQEQRAWLSKFLEERDARPTVILVHHHIGDDDYALLDGDRLLQLLEPHTNVKALFTAHRHTYRRRMINRLHYIAAPALGMPFTPGEPLGWLEATFEASCARLRFRVVGAEPDGEEARLDWSA